jgi:signal transduction histidine kinase
MEKLPIKTESNLNLLIITNNKTDIKKIVSLITEKNSVGNYDIIYSSKNNLSIIKNYDALVLNYTFIKSNSQPTLKQLPWLQDLIPQIPIILIADNLGEENLITCFKAGITGYVLKHNLEQLPEIITQTVSQFKQKNQTTKLELFCNLTHELRTPLTGILGFAKMLNEQIYGELNPKQLQYTHAILESGKHLLELINDLLDLSKLEAAKEELLIEKIAVEDVCLASISVIEQLAQEKNLNLKLEINEQVSFCFCDQKRVKQILINLLSNAIKFTQVGTITLRVILEKKNIVFSIIDTGIGIKQEDQSKLFQPFVQLQTPIYQQYKGTGLGLALSLKLAKLHGGNITFTSELGKGSCFSFILPSLSKIN